MTSTRGIDILNSFGSLKKEKKPASSESKRVSSFTFFPTLALPRGLHGAMVRFRDADKAGGITSLQTYSQIARHASFPGVEEVLATDSFLDVHAMRTKSLTIGVSLTRLVVAISKLNSLGLRTEIGVCVSSLNKEGIALAVNKSLQFYSESVVPFETNSLLKFSSLWASMASNLHLFSIQCLSNHLADVSNRLCHLSVSSFFNDILRQFVSGRTYLSNVTKLFVEAAKVTKFPLLARPSKKMSDLLRLKPFPPLEAVEDPNSASENYHASVNKLFFFKKRIIVIHFIIILFSFFFNFIFLCSYRFVRKLTSLPLILFASIRFAYRVMKFLFVVRNFFLI